MMICDGVQVPTEVELKGDAAVRKWVADEPKRLEAAKKAAEAKAAAAAEKDEPKGKGGDG